MHVRPLRRLPIAAAALPLAALFALLAGLALLGTALGCARGDASPAAGKRVLVLGIDGMDHALASRLMAEGRLPNLSRLAERGTFQPLGTAAPPLSPVAWSTFITGMDPGGHGIFDFIHRDPKTLQPYLSTSRAEPPGRFLKLGGWQFPLKAGETVLLRRGQPFWEVLEARGVETTILRIPANFPPSGTATHELSGMGTPDLLGTYGTFSFFTSELFFEKKDMSGGDVYELDYWDHVARGRLRGPANDLKVERPRLEAEFALYVDEENPVAELVLGDERRVLAVGEWSDWVPFEFAITPINSLPAMVRFYLRSVRPEVELYASPLNIDPMAPAQPISTPDSYAATLARATGRYYTQGMPEDTKARTERVLTAEEFLTQARIAGRELEDQYRWVLDNWKGGLLFYYFGNLDLVSHIMWRSMDPGHPKYDAERDGPFADVVPSLYEDADRVVGHTLDKIGDETTLIVMSDHGFSTWRRAFHLNAWLYENGYLAVKDPNLRKDPGLFLNVDWSKTRAYGAGFNGLYVNQRGREKYGIVDAAKKGKLLAEIEAKLLATVDPATERPAITRVYVAERDFRDRGQLDVGPDLVVGFAKGTRGSNDSLLGEVVPFPVFSDNEDEWTGDHGMDHEAVPGVLFTSRPLARPAPDLRHLAAAILAEYGVEEFPVRR